MRCPNCGNENPPDYMFCDECGARLASVEKAAGMPDLDAEGSATDLAASTAAATSSAPGIVNLPSMSEAQPYSDPLHTSSPDLSMGMSSNMDMPIGNDDSGMDMNTNMGADTSAANPPTPVTEDTMPPSFPSYNYDPMDASSSTSDDAAASSPSMPDVTPIAPITEAEYADTFEAVPVDVEHEAASAAVNMGSADTDGGAVAAPATEAGGGGTWAADALKVLESAQQAIASGDWSGFGQAMHTLKSALESAAAGVVSTVVSAVQPMLPSMGAPAPTDADSGATGDQASMPVDTTPAPAPAPAPVPAPHSSYDSGPSISDWGSSSMASDNGATDVPTPAPTVPSYISSSNEPTASAVIDAEAGSSMAPHEEEMEEAIPTPLPTPIPMPVPDTTDAGAGMARLVVISTGAELSLPEQEEITVGREDPSSGIFPDVDLTPYGGEDGGVSRRHARMLHIGDDYFVEDLQSTNYTKLDGQRLPAHVRERLEDGARLDFGRVAVIFRRG